MKKLLAFLFPVIMLLSSCGGGADSETDKSSSKAANSTADKTVSSGSNESSGEGHVGFHVDGTKLLDANGNEFVMRGVNHAHSWFAGDDTIALMAIDNTESNCVRLVLADGEQWTKDSVDSINTLVERCKEYHMVAVVEVHDATGRDSIDDLQKAADFWIEMKDALIGNEDYVILNIANEWVGSWESDTWAEGYTTVIPQLREAGIKNTIMVDAAGWGQYGQSIADNGKEVFDSDPEGNTMFSIHMYGSAGKNEKTIKKNLTGVTDQGLCVCVGEFGYKHSDGDVDEGFIMEYCQQNNIGWLGWSWKGNGGGVEYLDLSNDWEGEDLSPEWGEVLVNGEYGTKATSQECSVFN